MLYSTLLYGTHLVVVQQRWNSIPQGWDVIVAEGRVLVTSDEACVRPPASRDGIGQRG
jgi:hypothetical protein